MPHFPRHTRAKDVQAPQALTSAIQQQNLPASLPAPTTKPVMAPVDHAGELSFARGRVNASEQALKDTMLTKAGLYQSRDPLTPELRPQFDRMNQAAKRYQNTPSVAAPRDVNGFKGGLQTLGYAYNATRDQQTGAYNPAAAGILALLGMLAGDKEAVGSQIAQVYDQPQLDQQRQRALQDYQVESGILGNRARFTRNQTENDIAAMEAIAPMEAEKYRVDAGMYNNAYDNYIEQQKFERSQVKDAFEDRVINDRLVRVFKDGSHKILGDFGTPQQDKDAQKFESQETGQVVQDAQKYFSEFPARVEIVKGKLQAANQMLEAVQNRRVMDVDGSKAAQAQRALQEAQAEKAALASEAQAKAAMLNSTFPGLATGGYGNNDPNSDPYFNLTQAILQDISRRRLNYTQVPQQSDTYRFGTYTPNYPRK